KEGEVDAFCFDRQLESISVAVERPRALPCRRGDVLLVVSSEEAVFQCAVRRFVNELNGILRDRHHGNNGHERGRLNALQTVTGLYVFDSHQVTFSSFTSWG